MKKILTFEKQHALYFPGDTAGFEPDVADALIAFGVARPATEEKLRALGVSSPEPVREAITAPVAAVMLPPVMKDESAETTPIIPPPPPAVEVVPPVEHAQRVKPSKK